jgi:hypothetical protein
MTANAFVAYSLSSPRRFESINCDNVHFNELNDFRNKCSSYIDRNEHIQHLAKHNHLIDTKSPKNLKNKTKSGENHMQIKVNQSNCYTLFVLLFFFFFFLI